MSERKIAVYPTDEAIIPFLKYGMTEHNIVACFTGANSCTLGKTIQYSNNNL